MTQQPPWTLSHPHSHHWNRSDECHRGKAVTSQMGPAVVSHLMQSKALLFRFVFHLVFDLAMFLLSRPIGAHRGTLSHTRPGSTGRVYCTPARISGLWIPGWAWLHSIRRSSPSRLRTWTWQMKAHTSARCRRAADRGRRQCTSSSKVSQSLRI